MYFLDSDQEAGLLHVGARGKANRRSLVSICSLDNRALLERRLGGPES